MYAIVQTGGKQYKVSPGDRITIEKIDGDPGSDIVFDKVLMVVGNEKDQVSIGRPMLDEAKVTGHIVKQKKGDKIIVFKSKRRKGYRKKTGHRQLLTEIEIHQITA